MYRLECADEEASGERSDRELSPTPSTDTQTGHPRGTRSLARKRRSSSQTTSDSSVAKMPRTSASGEDAMVGQTVPSTIVDPSSGTRTTLSSSSFDVNIAVDAGKRAIIVKPARKFGIKDLALKSAPT